MPITNEQVKAALVHFAKGNHISGATDEDRMRAVLEAYEESLWQPIETGPKDGRTVLLFGIVGGEINRPGNTPITCVGMWNGGKSDWGGSDWWDVEASDGYAVWCKATHWRPLPPPPKEK